MNVPVIGKPLDFAPLSDFVLMEEVKENETPGGIALPDNVAKELGKARVVAVGPGRVTEFGIEVAMPVKVGDFVYVSFVHPPLGIPLNGKQYGLIRARDLAGVVKC